MRKTQTGGLIPHVSIKNQTRPFLKKLIRKRFKEKILWIFQWFELIVQYSFCLLIWLNWCLWNSDRCFFQMFLKILVSVLKKVLGSEGHELGNDFPVGPVYFNMLQQNLILFCGKIAFVKCGIQIIGVAPVDLLPIAREFLIIPRLHQKLRKLRDLDPFYRSFVLAENLRVGDLNGRENHIVLLKGKILLLLLRSFASISWH